MKSSVRLGFWIAALVAASFLAFQFFGTRHETWFVRAAQDNAVRCLTKSPCTRLMPDGGVLANARPPLGVSSVCARREHWLQLKGVSNGQTRIVLTCSDGATWLYHMGKLKGRNAGNEQWMRCGEATCAAEAKLFGTS